MQWFRGRPPGASFAVAVMAAGVFLVVGVAHGTIRNSKHDFSNTGGGGIWGSADESRICIFCHTPHNAQNVVAAPLWNREVTHNAYQLYTSATLDAPLDQPSGASALCLSCHDGSIAIDAFVNGAQGAPSMMALGDVYFPGSPFGEGGANIGGNFGGIIQNDLTNDHPVSFVYDDALAAADGELRAPAELPAELHMPSGRVECSTCHDVHNSAAVPGTKLLRLPKIGSALCLACHLK